MTTTRSISRWLVSVLLTFGVVASFTSAAQASTRSKPAAQNSKKATTVKQAPTASAQSKKTTQTKAKPAAKAASVKPTTRASNKASARSGKVVAANSRSSGLAAAKTKGKTSTSPRLAKAAPAVLPVTGLLSHDEMGGDGLLNLYSNAAMVVDQTTHEVLYDKNAAAVLPIASLTKLMTAMVVTDAGLSMDDPITITEADVDTLKGSSSRLAVGSTLSRGEMLHLALMSSENRAAHALGRTYPGGVGRFVDLMNQQARDLGMRNTHYTDPTGLSPENRSTARDLTVLVAAAHERPVIRELSTSPSHVVDTGRRTVSYRNSNQLVNNPSWEIGVQKTGYISEAGRCLVMQATVAGRKIIMVFLDSAGKLTRIAAAERVRKWILEGRADAKTTQRHKVPTASTDV